MTATAERPGIARLRAMEAEARRKPTVVQDLVAAPAVMTETEMSAAEAIIERGRDAFMQVGAALSAIHDGQGYRLRGFGSFESYLRDRWHISRQHGYRLMQSSAVAMELSPMGDSLGLCERQLREIAQLPREDRRAVAERAARDYLSTRALGRIKVERRVQRVRDARVDLLSTAPATGDRADCWIDAAEASQLPAPYLNTNLFVTSPPYGIGLEGSDVQASLDWQDYLAFAQVWAAEMYANAHPEHGRLCLNVPLDRSRGSREPVYGDWLQVLRSVGWKYESTIVWKEGNVSNHQARGSVASPNAPHAVAPVEMILVMYRGRWERGEPHRPSDIREFDWIDWLSTTWTFAGEHRYRVGHMAPFPEELPRRLIQLFSFPGDLVGDPFLGSGTTAVAALKLGRRCVGSDIDPECVSLARARVALAQRNVTAAYQELQEAEDQP